jgi:FtsH-binding integral membrane protein
MKIVVIILFLAIVVSLASGLWFLAKDNHGSTRTLTALKFRVALSTALIIFLLASYFAGWLNPSG